MNSSRGFTLIETLIYLALFSIIIGGMLVSTYNLIEGGNRASARVKSQEEASFVLRKLDWLLAGSPTINLPASGNTGLALSVTRADLPASDSPLTLDLAGSVLRLKRGSAAAVPISSLNVAVTSLSVMNIAPASGKPGGIKIQFTLDSEPYEITKYLRT